MFYSQFILAKKGPLGTIWIAAHLERKLRKNQVADTDIGVSVDSILFPEVPIALRLSSHLLLGVVRIYSRKVNYLFDDCSEALLKIKQAFRSTAVDLPPEESKAPYHSITLPETFDLDDFELPDTELLQGNFIDHHVSAKEQITLQDTMDGVVYSTSQFGLDERFGDGDASLIGLDLDEELLLNKGTPSGHGVLRTSNVDPQTSFEPSSTQKGDELDEEMHQASQAIAINCCIEAPSTPGLVEGPNLPITQEAFVSDDHMEEDHNPTELGAKVKGGSAPSHVEYGTGQAAVRDNGYALDNQKTDKSVSQVGSPPTAEPMELIDSSNIAHISSSNKASESSEGMHVECIQNGSLGDSDLNGALAVKCSGEAQENGSNVTVVPASKSIRQPCNFHSNEENVEFDNVLSTSNLPPKDFGDGPEGMSGREDASDVSVARVQDIMNMELDEHQLLDAAPCNNIDEQPFISGNVQFEKGRDSIATDLPSPEKMRSLPDGLPVSQSNELFVGSTPEREVLVQGDQDATMNKISGKKRSLTESTITLQSLNSIESSEAAQSKRTADFVPDDDDLLSSILVGRRSAALKVKSTPPVFDLVSSKRPRVTPRCGAQKRKVVVDDSTVLHGDTIREQLVNTADIRRVRKKASSTHPEIWILQKQFLEDEMFNEPIFTGVSAELISLHCKPFDLSETKLVQDDESKAHSIAIGVTGSPVGAIVGGETEFGGTSVPSVSRDESASQSAEGPYDTPFQASVRVSTDLGGYTLENETMNDSGIGHTLSQFDISENRTETEVECRREPVGDDAAYEKDVLPVEHLSVVGIASGEAVDKAAYGDIVEHRSEEGNLVVGTEDVDSAVPMTGSQPHSSFPVNDENIVAEDRISDEGRAHEPVTVNKEEFPEANQKYYDGGLSLDHQREELKTDSSIAVERDLGPETAVSSEAGDIQNHLAESQIFMDNIAMATSDHPTFENLNDLEADTIELDTDFLNFDDDELAEEAEDSMPIAEGPQILDNSGWSTRTRAVANYLQVLFQKVQHGRKDLHLNNLLVNKSRKEASRMFFETLVLKTRDYIQVEQESPFGNINVKPRGMLLKSAS